ncbi:MAG: YihY/virulence factor BrkB family protein [Spirochaetaceae bacterium]|jgi:membrane protein|nr:YihY/virulence factor BrkB family protein [Spirochaetaceae bacterium]
MKTLRDKITVLGETLVQYCWITFEFFNKHGLANHAAAGAYGFLFSAAPALLIVSFAVSRALAASPETAGALIGQLGRSLGDAFDLTGLVAGFLSASQPGAAGFVSIIGLFWTARVFALSLKRGINVIFPDPEKPLKKLLVSLGMEGAIILFTFIAALSSDAAFVMYQAAGVRVFSFSLIRLLPPAVLALLVFGAYAFAPAVGPKKSAALKGTAFCAAAFTLLIFATRHLFNPAKYNIIYGALGNLIILLADVYFFFMFFFAGAEMAFIINSFDALRLSRFIQFHTGAGGGFEKRFFLSKRGAVAKYLRSYEAGETVFRKGDESREVYYSVDGEAEVYLEENTLLALIAPGRFFGEMGHLLSEGRSATIKAHTRLETLVIPPHIFQELLKHNPDADKQVIEILSQRLKNVNEKLVASDQGTQSGHKNGAEAGP